MRIAYVQGGGQEAVEAQASRLRRFVPDRYQIEANPTAGARQRLVELLDSLRPGDELCLASLHPLRLDVGDAVQVLLQLLSRGIRLILAQADGSEVAIDRSTCGYALLEALGSLPATREKLSAPKSTPTVQAMLTDCEIDDIRRLAAAGLSPRRIGLIYRRSPKCISDVIWGSGPTPATQRHA